MAIVTDIEGTTTPISFVQNVLFPFARERIPEWVYRRRASIEAILEDVQGEVGQRLSAKELVETLQAWIDSDRKATPLKTLQGHIWEEAYREGILRSPIYPDVAPALRAWREAGQRLAVYSSGSEQAQRLIFGHTEEGDLSGFFEAWFDTRVGAKRSVGSYREIARRLGEEPRRIRFLSDVVEELDAAKEAGFKTSWVVRDGELDSAARHRQVRSFAEVDLLGERDL